MKQSSAFKNLDNQTTPAEVQKMLNASSLYFTYTTLKVSDQLLLKYIKHYSLSYKKAFRTINDLTAKEKEEILNLWNTTVMPKRDISKQFLIGPTTMNRLLKEKNIVNRHDKLDNKEWIKYQKLVLRLTRVIIRFYNMASVPGYEWDHRYSIHAGFTNNVHPNIIASRENLELIPAKENRANGEECSITLSNLIKLVC